MTNKEFALNIYWDDCLKAAKVNLFTGELVFIKTLADEDEFGITNAATLREYTESVVGHRLIHESDVSAYLYCSDIEMIRRRALNNKTNSNHTFRRQFGEVFKWITYEITAPKNFSEENPWALITWREADSEAKVMEDAMKMLSTIFYKVLKIDLTNETHEDIKVFDSEKTSEYGYSANIIEWFRGFAETGCVHEEDKLGYLAFTNINSLRDTFRHSRDCRRFRYRRKTGDGFRWVCMEIIPSIEYTDDEQIVMLYIRDIHDEYIAQLERERELEYYCSCDTLTGIGNRYYFNNLCDLFEKHYDFSPVGVVFADINGLKYTNDNFGHTKGDELIKGFAQKLSEQFGKENCSRISGDEFVVLVKNAQRESFLQMALIFHSSLCCNGEEPPAAIGYAWTEDATLVKSAVRTAETNMYADKQRYYELFPHSKR